MSRRLPPLNQLRAFEAAARLGSFKAAGDELNVTHAAISHQIKALEDYLGHSLFRRAVRKVHLLPEVKEYAAALTRYFDGMATETNALARSFKKARLRISCVPAFGYRFVLPNIAKFHDQHPDIAVELTFDAQKVDLTTGEFDAAIRYGRGDWPGLQVDPIFRDRLTPVCAPAFLRSRDLPLVPEEIAALPFAISPGGSEDWQTWLSGTGATEVARPAPLQLENRAVVLDFLLVGSGIALADTRFASNELSNGMLVRLSERVVDGVNSTCLVSPKASAQPAPGLGRFATWLRQASAALDPDIGMPWRAGG